MCSCEKQNKIHPIISKSLNEYGQKGTTIIYRESNNENIKNTNKYVFFDGNTTVGKFR